MNRVCRERRVQWDLQVHRDLPVFKVREVCLVREGVTETEGPME